MNWQDSFRRCTDETFVDQRTRPSGSSWSAGFVTMSKPLSRRRRECTTRRSSQDSRHPTAWIAQTPATTPDRPGRSPTLLVAGGLVADQDASRPQPEKRREHPSDLHLALKHAVEWGLLLANPMDSVRPPRWERKEQSWLDLDQAQALVAQLEATAAGTAVLVKLSTGLRMGELLGLRWTYRFRAAVDWSSTTVAMAFGSGYTIADVKTHRSRRPCTVYSDRWRYPASPQDPPE